MDILKMLCPEMDMQAVMTDIKKFIDAAQEMNQSIKIINDNINEINNKIDLLDMRVNDLIDYHELECGASEKQEHIKNEGKNG